MWCCFRLKPSWVLEGVVGRTKENNIPLMRGIDLQWFLPKANINKNCVILVAKPGRCWLCHWLPLSPPLAEACYCWTSYCHPSPGVEGCHRRNQNQGLQKIICLLSFTTRYMFPAIPQWEVLCPQLYNIFYLMGTSIAGQDSLVTLYNSYRCLTLLLVPKNHPRWSLLG